MPRSTKVTDKQIDKAIERYKKLPKKLGVRCRLIEALHLIALARKSEMGTKDEEIIRLFKPHGSITRSTIRIRCVCHDTNCSMWGLASCSCLGNMSIECDGVVPYAFDGTNNIIYPRGVN